MTDTSVESRSLWVAGGGPRPSCFCSAALGERLGDSAGGFSMGGGCSDGRSGGRRGGRSTATCGGARVCPAGGP